MYGKHILIDLVPAADKYDLIADLPPASVDAAVPYSCIVNLMHCPEHIPEKNDHEFDYNSILFFINCLIKRKIMRLDLYFGYCTGKFIS